MIITDRWEPTWLPRVSLEVEMKWHFIYSTLEFLRNMHTRLPNWMKKGQVKADVYGRHQFSNFRDHELTKSTYFLINVWLVSLGILGTRNGWESLNTMDSFVVVHIKKSNTLWGIRPDLEVVSKIMRVGQTIRRNKNQNRRQSLWKF